MRVVLGFVGSFGNRGVGELQSTTLKRVHCFRRAEGQRRQGFWHDKTRGKYVEADVKMREPRISLMRTDETTFGD